MKPRVLSSLIAVATLVLVAHIGFRVGRVHEWNLILDSEATYYKMPRHRKLLVSLREAMGLVAYHSQHRQDKWVAALVYPGVRDGYYVDVGAGDGVVHSNSKTLDDRGWRGLCIDPFPTNMDGRRCTVVREVVSSQAGLDVSFRAAGFLGGMADHLSTTKDWASGAPVVTLKTSTLTRILKSNQAPRFINYMSIDVEGAELETVKGFDFEGYEVGAFTIEHNNEEPKRTQIRTLLEGHGYRYALTLHRDDCYVLARVARQAGAGTANTP